MSSQDLGKIADKARRETEEFLNSHLHDRAKGWPLFRRVRSDYVGPRRVAQATDANRIRMELAPERAE